MMTNCFPADDKDRFCGWSYPSDGGRCELLTIGGKRLATVPRT